MGYLSALAAYILWGLSPIFWKGLKYIPPFELAAIRFVASFLTLILILIFLKKTKDSFLVFKGSPFFKLALSSLFMTTNVYLFIYAVNNDLILQASFGYFLSPIINVCVGLAVLKERITSYKIVALSLTIIAVFVQLGHVDNLSWMSFVLAFAFSGYAFMRKITPISTLRLTTFEVSVMTIPASFILFSFIKSDGVVFNPNTLSWTLVLCSGLVTLLPFIFFTIAAKKIPLSILGFIQYLAPLLQLICGIFLYGEVLKSSQSIAFGLVCASCLIVSYGQIRSSYAR